VVKSLTDRLGGTVTVANRGGGLEAVLRFPADAVADATPGGRGRVDLAGVRVLLAEDNPTNQMVATQMLSALNAEVAVAADGVEALERFEQEPVDLVVVDIEMPRLSGLDVIRAIRARGDARARVPIVALTAYAMREHRDRIAAAGADALISKPLTSVDALGRALAAHLAPPPAAPAPEPAAAPVVDAAVFGALRDAIGADMMAELLDKVVADLLGTRRELADALEPVDCGPIRSASHILISVAGAIGATRLHACARALNAAAHAGRLEGIVAEVRRCIDEIDAAVAFARDRRAAG
jgi:CheY-like chemotaxis protein